MARPSDDEGFVGATLVGEESGAPENFDASAYSFFGGPSTDALGLEGELEAGLDAPPEEDPLIFAGDEDLLDDFGKEEEEEDEDLSLAGLFRKSGKEMDDLGMSEGTMDEPAGLHLEDLLSKPSGGSMALGSLLASGSGEAFYTPSPPASQRSSAFGGYVSRPPVAPSPLGHVETPSGPILGPPLMGMAPPGPGMHMPHPGMPPHMAYGPPMPMAGPPGFQHPPPPPGLGMPPPAGLSASALEAALLAHSWARPPSSAAGTEAPQPPPMGMAPPPPHHHHQGPPPHHHQAPPPHHQPGPPHPGQHGPPHAAGPSPGPMPQGPPFGHPQAGNGHAPGAAPSPDPQARRQGQRARPAGPAAGPPGGPKGWAAPPGPAAPPAGRHQPSSAHFPSLGAEPQPQTAGADARPPPAGTQRQRAPLHVISQRLQGVRLDGRGAPGGRGPGPRPHQGPRPRRYRSQYMTDDEVDAILYSQWRGLQQGPPYAEDYYFQGFVYKYYHRRNQRLFAPDTVRELAPTEKLSGDQVSYVDLEGLGRVPFSNIRRPRPLMDVPADDSEAAAGGKPDRRRRLDQEPLLAARIMIEDCNCLVLDVQDIHRIFIAAANAPLPDEMALRSRRRLLLDGLAASLRLPEEPAGEKGADTVFCRLMLLRKGRVLAARVLEVTLPPPEERQRPVPSAPSPPNLLLLWAVLRNAPLLWPATAAGADEVAASVRVAAASAALIAALPSAQHVAHAAAALAAGLAEGALPALEAPGEARGAVGAPRLPWLGDVALALARRGAEARLSGPAKADDAPPLLAARKVWNAAYASLSAALRQQLPSLGPELREPLSAALEAGGKA